MKKKIFIFILIILFLFIVIKIREAIILNKVHSAIECFMSESNRYYCVYEKYNDRNNVEKEIYLLDNIEKQLYKNNQFENYCEWKDYKNGDRISYNENGKIRFKESIKDENYKYLLCLPRVISLTKLDKKHQYFELFKIHYIIPITYDGKSCYKISTNSEIVIIDKETFLPVYSTIKTANSTENDNNVEYMYKFSVGTVTDDDVALPDFSDYKIE